MAAAASPYGRWRAAPLTRSGLWMGLAACVVMCAGCLLVALAMGTGGVDPAGVWDGLRGEDPLIVQVRLPRVVLGAVVGGALALAGAALQALLKNPLADPYVVGVSGGAAVGGTLMVALLGSAAQAGGATWAPWALPLGAFAGAVLALVLLMGVVRWEGGMGAVAVLLSGVVFNAFCLAVVGIIRLLVSAETAQGLASWMMGSIASERWGHVAATAAYSAVGMVWLVALAGRLHVMAQGDELAGRLGVAVARTRAQAFVAVGLLVGGVVSMTGMIAFVGLLVPHAVRMVLGADMRRLMPASALVGAGLLPVMDGAARLCFPLWGTELPVGALTALCGGPVFLVLLRRHHGRGAA